MSDNIISVHNLCKTFGNFTAVNSVDFFVQPGEIFGYLGANGAGKSTTIRILCGLLQSTSGNAFVAGIDVNKYPNEVKKQIGYMSQKFSLYPDLTVQENLEFFGGIYGFKSKELHKNIEDILQETNLQKYAKTITGSLPGGIQQRVALGNSLLHSPKIIFLDEPTAGVDPASRLEFMSIVKNRIANGVTVFLTTHYLDEAEICSRVGLMVDGKLVTLGSPSELKAKHVPGEVILVRSNNLASIKEQLNSTHGVVNLQTYGVNLRIRFSSSQVSLENIKHVVLNIDATAEIETSTTSLNDVFHAVVTRNS